MANYSFFALPYSPCLLDHYQALSDLPGFVLLESKDPFRGRYDIVTAYPYDEYVVPRHAADLATVFDKVAQRLRLTAQSSLSPLPFQGGAIGYFSYDLGAQLAGITSPVQPGLEDMPLVDLQWYDWAIIADHALQEVTLVSANQRSETATIVQEIMARWKSSVSITQPFVLTQKFSPLISKSDYRHSFQAIHDALHRGRAYQVNYTQPFKSTYHGSSWELFKRIRNRNAVPFSAYLRLHQGELLSFSPERFIAMQEGHLVTSPIKGTMQRSRKARQDKKWKNKLLACEKNRAENVMIVDLMRNDIGRFAKPGTVRVSALCEAQSYAGVHHLVSHIEAQTDIPPAEALAQCFPGGSITGAPKREAMRIIHEQEAWSRGVYCGCIGYFSNHGRMDMNIAIRTMVANNEQLYLSAGGGIVIDSHWQDEYQECFNKIAGITKGII